MNSTHRPINRSGQWVGIPLAPISIAWSKSASPKIEYARTTKLREEDNGSDPETRGGRRLAKAGGFNGC